MVLPKIQQTKLLFTFQMFGDLFLFGLVWQYSSVRTNYNKGRFKVMATYLQQQYNFEPIFIHCNGYLSRLYFWVLLREQVFCFSHHLPDVLLFGDVLQPKERKQQKKRRSISRKTCSFRCSTIQLPIKNLFCPKALGSTKGGLISESFSLWLQSPKKGAKSLL